MLQTSLCESRMGIIRLLLDKGLCILIVQLLLSEVHTKRSMLLSAGTGSVKTENSPVESSEKPSLLTLFLAIKTNISHIFLVGFVKKCSILGNDRPTFLWTQTREKLNSWTWSGPNPSFFTNIWHQGATSSCFCGSGPDPDAIRT